MSIFGPGIDDSVDKFFIEKVGGAGHRVPPIRSSAVATYQLCPRKFLYDEKLGIKPRHYEGALSRGDIYHQFRAHLIQGTPLAQAEVIVKATLDKTKARLVEQAGSDGRLPGGDDLVSVISKADEDYAVAQAMAEAANDLYPLDPTVWRIAVHPKTGKPLVETLHEYDYGNAKVVMQFDRVLEHVPTGEIWLVDDKTTRFRPKVVAFSKSFAFQIRLYRTGLCDLFPPERVVGAIHTILQVPTIRQKQKESFREYVDRVPQWYKDKMAEGPDAPPIVQSTTRFDEPLWSEELQEVMNQQDLASLGDPVLSKFPRNDGACFKYERACPYLQLCVTEPATWPRFIPLQYDTRFRQDETKENRNE